MASLPVFKQATWCIIIWKGLWTFTQFWVYLIGARLLTASPSSKPQSKQNHGPLHGSSPKISSRNDSCCHRYWREIPDEVIEKRSLTCTAPCNDIISHEVPVGGTRVLVDHAHENKRRQIAPMIFAHGCNSTVASCSFIHVFIFMHRPP